MIEIISVKERIVNYLNDSGFSFRQINHSAATGSQAYYQILGMKYAQQVKAFLIKHISDRGEGFAIIAIQARKKPDLTLIAKKIGVSHVIPVSGDQLKEVTGCDVMELPPVAKPFGLFLLMDKDLLEQDLIYFTVGGLAFSIAMAPQDLLRLERPILF
ncbi:YbaK/EbsC family protein [Fulvivirgaceae bacterium BMA12]|uniref:YbaK/EbsC family protein n=1 Tax=Agaribacillus aureus TaxID=3051825 RepID=A0ABT8L5P5_9BACT|nr:YbaK/EbsC family protein [Fulvivirgaceae bacterium BMA12]